MFNVQSLHVAMLMWGCLFCCIAALCILLSKNFDRKKRSCMILMQSATALLLGCDALAWAFRGYPGQTGYFMVRISNFVVFADSNIVQMFFHAYICCYFFSDFEKCRPKREKLVYVVELLGVLLVIISQFTDLYYYFDADNFYHRNTWYFLSMIFPFAGMGIDLSLLVQYRKNVGTKHFVSMCSYIILPLLAAVVQIKFYGLALINVSICVSMILMFMSAMGEQSAQMGQLQYLSFRDMLTGMYNRNKYISVFDKYADTHIEKVGVAYIDLNGLKKINDTVGHDAGDKFICRAAKEISKVFADYAYRVGGDEFVIVVVGIEREEFELRMKTLSEELKNQNVSISAGSVWRDSTENLDGLLRQADRLMYEQKEQYHKNEGDYRR